MRSRRPRDDGEPPGRPARRLAIYVVDAVVRRREGFDEAFNAGLGRLGYGDMPARDRAFARAVALATLRRKGSLDAVLATFLDKPLPGDSGRTGMVLVTAAAQLLLLDAPAHAVISQAVDIVRLDRDGARFDRLVNAVLRRVAGDGKAILAGLDAVTLDVPGWLMTRWTASYGEATARAIAAASLSEPALDLTVAAEAERWAATLGGMVLSTGSVRLPGGGRIEDLAGYAEGAWWVQDAAAALPVRLLGPVAGKSVADLCAAPGGKTMQLAAAGAVVTAVDASAKRSERLRANLARIDREVRIVTADVVAWAGEAERAGAFDAVLLDAPCSATGTIRRHPDLMYTKAETEIARLAGRQIEMLRAAARLVAPGGVLVYATCSLEPEEGPAVVAAFLAENPAFVREQVEGVAAELITAEGDLRTLPHHAPAPEAMGMDGFFAARLRRLSGAGGGA